MAIRFRVYRPGDGRAEVSLTSAGAPVLPRNKDAAGRTPRSPDLDEVMDGGSQQHAVAASLSVFARPHGAGRYASPLTPTMGLDQLVPSHCSTLQRAPDSGRGRGQEASQVFPPTPWPRLHFHRLRPARRAQRGRVSVARQDQRGVTPEAFLWSCPNNS
jgi:hypothetical protein